MNCRALVIAVGLAFTILVSGVALAQTPATALTGLVGSAENNAMEGVLVSASKTGSPVSITVVTDKDGRYSFPASKLAPGQYSLGVRAVGYDLDPTKQSRSQNRRRQQSISSCARPKISPRNCRTANGWQASPVPINRKVSCSIASVATRSSASCGLNMMRMPF